ncbi:LysR family transcriptional regulator [Methylobacterium sp. 77]|uniref:LysR family transcriptional regulator n=1 Tax=Methylobacterium sp. 77 TaxID=1101192 RepID=UPI00036FB4A5|nr:LysR family transcriptional regulator [Methylobacterium sp. 77]
MELRHLRYFVAVAERLSFTVAAADLGVAQPPLSQQIRDLEADIGTRLFERTTRRVSLTPAGEDFLIRAKAILHNVQDAAERAQAIGCGSVGVLNVGLTGSMLAGPLGRLIYNFQASFTGVDIQIHEMSPDKQIAALKSGQTDISFLRTPPQDPGLVSELAWKEGINVVLPRGHRIRTDSIGLSQLKDERFVFLRLRDSLFAKHILQCCVSSGFYPKISQQAVEAASLTSLVAAGFGVALIPEFVSNLAHAKVSYRRVISSTLSADVHALYHLRSGPIAHHFLAKMRSDAGDLVEQLRLG